MNIAIVDDCREESGKIKEFLHRIAEEKYMTFNIFCFESGEAFLDIFENNSFDIIFMDIYMNGINGLETAKEIRKTDNHCLLIFTTVSMEHMPEAFSCHAFEYIQKPVNEERIIEIMTDALNILPVKTQYMEFISNRQTVRLMYSEFITAVTFNHYLNITDINNRTYKIRQTMSEFMNTLKNDRRFLQINKGIIVNIDYIVSIEDNICTLENGQILPVKVRDNLKIKEIWYQHGFKQIRTSQKRRK